MYLTVSKPRNRFSVIGNEMDRMLTEMFNNFNGDSLTENDAIWSPRVDLHETADKFVVQIDLPGVDKNDVKVQFEDNVLTISGERKYEAKNEDKDYRHVERVYGSFSRSLRLAKDVDAQRIEASYKNGVLEIALPKAEEVKPKQIEVKIG